MFILTILSVVFLGLAIKSLFGDTMGSRFDAYFFFMLLLSVAAAVLPVRHIMFEYRLADVAERLIDHDNIDVHCQSYFDNLYNLGWAGFVTRGSAKITLDVRTCNDLREYLDHPAQANPYELYSVHVLTHETMHVAKIYNEIKADCSAFQRNHRTAKLLGVPEGIANTNAIMIHRYRSPRSSYYSA
ncbi:MAG: hypothetical protein J4F41_09310 [Alphaproteobacteria bacterium]|nr:hypothetical protein [Alphaproteobacteria bacterium]